jgi:mono/diheme cytochrome c family protein
MCSMFPGAFSLIDQGKDMIDYARPYGVAVAALSLFGVLLCITFGNANAAETQVQRGKYLVSIEPCTDCHTPGYFLGKPDMARYLGGSDVGFEVPGLGVFYAPNLTPDDETGLGKWTKEQIATAITTGVLPDGRILAPPMPVESFKHLTHSDALAIAAYLKTLPEVKHKVPGPFGQSEKPTSFVFQVLPPDKYVPTPPPGAPAK